MSAVCSFLAQTCDKISCLLKGINSVHMYSISELSIHMIQVSWLQILCSFYSVTNLQEIPWITCHMKRTEPFPWPAHKQAITKNSITQVLYFQYWKSRTGTNREHVRPRVSRGDFRRITPHVHQELFVLVFRLHQPHHRSFTSGGCSSWSQGCCQIIPGFMCGWNKIQQKRHYLFLNLRVN